MARRTMRRSGPGAGGTGTGPAPEVGVLPVGGPAGPGPRPWTGPSNGQETTGRYLVLMEPDGLDIAVSALTDRTSIKLAYAGDFGGDPGGALAIGESEGVVFEDLGVALVNAPPDQAAAVSSLVNQGGSLRLMEAERVVHAIGGVDPSYLRGYRDAVNHLVDQVLKGGAAGNAGVAAAIDQAAFAWGLQVTGADRSRFTGRGIKVAVLDTGLDLAHPDFAGRPVSCRSFVDAAPTVQDGHGHGTHCAGIAAGPARPGQSPRFGVAPDAELFIGKVLGDDGRGVDGGILAGLQWAVSSGCEVISMSLGAKVLPGQAHSTIFEQAARRALDRGSLILAAAGNDSRRPDAVAPVGHPANCPSILAVAAVDETLGVAWFSSGSVNADGGAVDLAGPGVSCRSSWPAPVLYKDESGTSMATPHAAGIAALVAESDPSARGARLHLRLLQTARRLVAPAADVGAGLVRIP